MSDILVTYVTKKGSTAEIAQAIAKELQAAGHTADTIEIKNVTTLSGYKGIVIGGPMYLGHVDSNVKKFSIKHSGELAKVPVAGFVVCIAAASNDPEGMAWAEKALHKALDPLRLVDEAIFAGKLDPEKLSWFQRWITKNVNSPVGDFRDWEVIAAFARGLPVKMKL
jgi:menaquinone-dependent protoporphyrinogen oxidase